MKIENGVPALRGCIMGKTIITEKEITEILRKENAEISDTDLKWKLFHYCKDNGLQSIGAQQYTKVGSLYDYELGSTAETIRNNLRTQYPEIKLVVWESSILNEWLNLLIAKNTIFIETPKDFLDTIYDALTESDENTMVLVNPKTEEYFRYQKNDLIVLRTMVDRAPISKNNHLTIEKLFVDLLCDKLLIELFDGYTVQELIQDAAASYAVNEKKLLAYARRRGRYNEILAYWRKINDR